MCVWCVCVLLLLHCLGQWVAGVGGLEFGVVEGFLGRWGLEEVFGGGGVQRRGVGEGVSAGAAAGVWRHRRGVGGWVGGNIA